MIKKEYFLLMRRKKFLALVMLLPLILGIIFSTVPDLTRLESVDLIMCDFDNTTESLRVIKGIEQEFNLKLLEPQNPEQCLSNLQYLIKQDKYLIGIEIPKGFGWDLENMKQTQLRVYYDDSKFNLGMYVFLFVNQAIDEYKTELLTKGKNELKDKTSNLYDSTQEINSILVEIKKANLPFISDYVENLINSFNEFSSLISLIHNMDTRFLSNPIWVNTLGVYGNVNSLGVSFAIIFVILNLFTLFMITSTSVIRDKSQNYFVRLKTNKVFSIEYFFSKISVFTLLSFIQLIILFLVFLIQGSTFKINILVLFLSVLLITTLNSLIGISIGLVSNNETIAILLSLILTLPFLFLSGVFAPIDLFPKAIRFVAKLFPLSVEINLVSKSVLFKSGFKELSNSFNFLIDYVVGFLLFNSIIMRKK